MSEISTLLYQYLTTQFSKLDWKPGSVIRELVAEPMVKLSEQATAELNRVYDSIDIQRLLDNPEQYSDEITELFNTFGLSSPPASASTGFVQLLLNVDPATAGTYSFTINDGASFTYEDVTLMVTANYTVSTTTPTTSNQLLLSHLQGTVYSVIVPVTSVNDGISLSEGTSLGWNGINADVYSATVYDQITGGVSTYTATQKINKIRQQLVPQSLTCREGILRAINEYSEDLAVDCLPVARSVSGGANIYVKTTAINSPTEYINAVQLALDQYTGNLGIQFTVIAPRNLTLHMYLPTSAPLNTVLRTQIADAVNNSLLNATQLGDATIAPIIAKAGITLAGAGSYMLIDNATDSARSSLSTINLTPFMSDGAPCAIYTSIDQITFKQ